MLKHGLETIMKDLLKTYNIDFRAVGEYEISNLSKGT